MRTTIARALFCAAALASCAGSPHTNQRERVEAPPPRQDFPPRPPRTPGRPYAETPVTQISDELTSLAIAAATDAPLPATAAPLRSPLERPPEVYWHTARPEASLLTIGIAFEVEAILKRGQPEEDAAPAQRWGSVRLTLVLTRNGLRLYSVRPRTMSRSLPGGTLPAGMEGFAEVASELLAGLRRGDVSAWALDDADRRLLASDEVWTQVQQDRVSATLVAQIQTMLETLPEEPLAYRLDSVAVLVADGEDRLLSLALEWDAEGGSFVLETAPLLEVRQLWPRPSPRRSTLPRGAPP